MPNFWTTTSQKIYEAFNGPRTRDTEFASKVEEMNSAIGSLKKIFETIRNFPSRTSGIQQTCKEFVSNCTTCYGDNPFYSEFLKDICDAHRNVESAYLSMIETVNTLSHMNSEFDKKYAEIQSNLHRREEARQIYDHYDKKMETLVLERNEKVSKNQQEDAKDIEKFDRNDGKYKRAANDLIQLSQYCYRMIQELLDYKFRIINPIVGAFIKEEKKFFDLCSNVFRRFEFVEQKVESFNRNYQSTIINYDPSKYIRANRLLMGVNTSNLPRVVNKEKYTYEDYKNRNQNMNNTEQNPNLKFSYAAYINASSNKNTSTPISNTPNTNIINNNNNPYLINATPPSSISGMSQSNVSNKFSYEAYKNRTQSIVNNDNNKSQYGNFSNPYQTQPPKDISSNSNNPFIINPPSTSLPNMTSNTKPINDYNFGVDYSKGSNNTQSYKNTYNPYEQINFDKPLSSSSQSNPLPPPASSSNPFGNVGCGASFFQPSGNDYLKYINQKSGQQGGYYDNDFPK